MNAAARCCHEPASSRSRSSSRNGLGEADGFDGLGDGLALRQTEGLIGSIMQLLRLDLELCGNLDDGVVRRRTWVRCS